MYIFHCGCSVYSLGPLFRIKISLQNAGAQPLNQCNMVLSFDADLYVMGNTNTSKQCILVPTLLPVIGSSYFVYFILLFYFVLFAFFFSFPISRISIYNYYFYFIYFVRVPSMSLRLKLLALILKGVLVSCLQSCSTDSHPGTVNHAYAFFSFFKSAHTHGFWVVCICYLYWCSSFPIVTAAIRMPTSELIP